MQRISDSGELSDSDEQVLDDAIAEAIDDFGPDFDAEGNALEEGESDRIKSEEERARPGRSAGEATAGEEVGAGAGEAEREAEEVTA
jgi:hypothetical protein